MRNPEGDDLGAAVWGVGRASTAAERFDAGGL